MHDELGDTVELTAELSHRALDALERLRRDHGLGFDYFLVDCFWFDPRGGYRSFKQTHWPNGFEPVLERILALGMRPGLWYSTNGLHLDVEAWDDSRDGGGKLYSLADGSYAEQLEAAWRDAIERWGLGLIKLDFAALTVPGAGHDRPADETYRRSVGNLKRVLRSVRDDHPDLRVIAHCGFARAHHAHAPGGGLSPGVDPSWLEVLDHLFSGDPAPGDIPRTSLPRAADLYQDQKVFRLHRDGLPLHRIEDHGAMVGNTNTCLYRGRLGVRRSHLGNLARGGRRDMLYGDPSLLNDEDARVMVRLRELFFDAYACGLETCFIGNAEPGLAPWHGYLTGGGDAGLLYLVNATMTTQTAAMTLPGVFRAEVLFDDGQRPTLQSQPDRLTVELAPEQVTLIGLGRYADPARHAGGSDDPPPTAVRCADVRFVPAPGGLTATLPAPAQAGEHLLVLVRLLEAEPPGPLLTPPHVAARENSRQGPPGRSAMLELVDVELLGTDGQAAPALEQLPSLPMWAGISWTARRFEWIDGGTLSVRLTQKRRFVVEAYAVQSSP